MMSDSSEFMTGLHLAHVLIPALGDMSDVLLIRHPISNRGVREAVAARTLFEYTRSQPATFRGQQRWWVVFLGEEANSARFVACYENRGRISEDLFDLAETAVLQDLRGRLIIDWGLSTRAWFQKGTGAHTKNVLVACR